MSDLLDDKFLLAQIQLGDKTSFTQLYKKYWRQTYANAYKRLNDVEQAEDVVQEIFVNIWLKRETLIHNFPAYLNIAVRNRVIKLGIKQQHTSPFLDIFNNIPATNQNADSNISWNEFYDAYQALLSTLPPKRQRIFRLRFHEDLTTNEIAIEMGITRKTVQNQLGKAVEQLRASLLSFIIILSCYYHS